MREDAFMNDTDSFFLDVFSARGQKIGELEVVYYPFRFSLDEQSQMRKTLNESALRQSRIDQLSKLLEQPIVDQAAELPRFEPAALTVSGVQMVATPRGITSAQYQLFSDELQSLLKINEDATAFMRNFAQSVMHSISLEDSEGRPFDWHDAEVKAAKLRGLPFAILKEIVSEVMNRVTVGKVPSGDSQPISLVTVRSASSPSGA